MAIKFGSQNRRSQKPDGKDEARAASNLHKHKREKGMLEMIPSYIIIENIGFPIQRRR